MQPMQRLRITFSRGQEVKYITHLDLMRLWERALRRAGIPVAYSEGFSPHPHLSLAAPLPVGVTSEGELMDLHLGRRISPHYFLKAVCAQLPKGVDIREVIEVTPKYPSIQSQVRFAEYRVLVETDREFTEIEQAISSLLAKESLPWQHMRDTGAHQYDLRALIDDIWVEERQGTRYLLGMRLRADSSGTGRAEQVTAALGFPEHPNSIHRTRLILARS